jgi:hypothetical protein
VDEGKPHFFSYSVGLYKKSFYLSNRLSGSFYLFLQLKCTIMRNSKFAFSLVLPLALVPFIFWACNKPANPAPRISITQPFDRGTFKKGQKIKLIAQFEDEDGLKDATISVLGTAHNSKIADFSCGTPGVKSCAIDTFFTVDSTYQYVGYRFYMVATAHDANGSARTETFSGYILAP